MSKKNEAWGVEVGAQAIKVLKLARAGNGVAVEDFEVLPFKHVLTTPDLNVEEAIRVNLDALAQKHEFDKSTVVVSVPGHMAFARFAKLPPIEASKVKSIVAYEAQQQIPFPIDEVEWDYQVFAQDDAPDIEVGIFAITKERVAQFLSNYRSVGMRVDMLTLSPVAVYNAFAYETAEGGANSDNSVYLDIGTVSTDIIVVEAGGIWLRTLPLGGNHFTNALMKQFKISFAKAEKLKLEAGTSKYAKQIFQAMRGVFSDLVSEIQRSLGFYQSLNRDSELTRIVGVGSTWKLPGLQKYLKQNLQMDVVRPDGFERLEIDGRRAAEFSSVAVNMATAYGLALQGLGLSSVDANILPQAILRQRMWKQKQPWFGAAAACVAGGAGVAAVMHLMAGSGYEAAKERAWPEVERAIGDAEQLKSQFDTVQTNDPRPGIRNFRRSFDYTNLYPKLIEDVSAAMATIPPHEDLRDVDWTNPDDIARAAAVARADRDQVWIKEVITSYSMPSAAGAVDDGMAVESFDEFSGEEFDEFSEFDESRGLGGMIDESSGGASAPSGLTPVVPFPDVPTAGGDDAPLDEFSGDEFSDGTASSEPEVMAPSPAPRIIVTIRGETTMGRDEISRLLRERFVGWLEANAQRPDRPYVLVPALNNPKFIRRGQSPDASGGGVEFGSDTSGTSGLRRTPTPVAPTGTPGLGPGGLQPGLIQPGAGGIEAGGFNEFDEGFGGGIGGGGGGSVEVQTPEGWYAQLGASSGGFSPNALLPMPPLSVEENADDHLFTFTFEVILLSPDEARKTLLPQPEPEPGDDNTQPETVENTAANLNAGQEQDS